MNRLLRVLVIAGTGLLGLAVAAPTASAGGWANTTLDPLPPVEEDGTVAVGFMIRQHGVTPVDVDDVAILVTGADGTVTSFPARLADRTGHYMADVTFPAEGTYRWSVRQGWFGEQSLGEIVVGGQTTTAATTSDGATPTTTDEHRWPGVLRYGLPVLGFGLACLSLVDGIGRVSRRRRPAAVPA